MNKTGIVLIAILSSFTARSQWPIHREAESYNSMTGVKILVGGVNNTGLHVSKIDPGDQINYVVSIPTTRIYKITVKTSGTTGGRLQIRNGVNGVPTTIDLKGTRSNYFYETTSSDLKLPAGSDTLRVVAVTGNWNLDWIEIDTTSLLLMNKFESTADFSDWAYQEMWRAGQQTISDSFKRKGTYSARFELLKSDTIINVDAIRSELRRNSETDSVRWYGFSQFLRKWVYDEQPEAIAQWHEWPDWHLEEGYRSPPIGLYIDSNQYKLKILWADSVWNTNNTKDGEDWYYLGPVKSDVWVDWVFEIKFSSAANGIIRVWMNGKLVLERLGPNCYNDITLPYFKIGIYKWPWKGWQKYSPQDRRIVYYDEVRIGNRQSSYEEVKPGSY